MNFRPKFAQKINFGLEIQKTNGRIKISILEIPSVLNFWPNGCFRFSAQVCPKTDFYRDLESAPPRYHKCQFSVKTNNVEFFGLNLGKMPNFMRYFGSDNVEGVAE